MSTVALDQAIEPIRDGALLAIPPDYSGVAMAATRALIRCGVRGLRLVALPQSGLQADLLIGAGLAVEIETAAVTLGEAGIGPRFAAALGAGTLRIKDATCPVQPGDPIVLIPAIRPDVAFFHAPMADAQGNVWIGRRRELVSLAHAAAETVVTVDRLYDGNLLEDEILAAGVLPALYVTRIALAPGGTWPLQSSTAATDAAHIAEYARLARTDAGFAAYLDRFLRAAQAA